MAAIAMAGRQIERVQERQGTRRTAGGRALSVAERNAGLYEQQRARRRGPTPEMFFTKHIDNSRILKADEPERPPEMRSLTFAMTLLFAFTMVYVWQHFSAIEVGYKVEAQKSQVEKLREQNRQLKLTEAELSDPGRIDRIARQLGLDQPLPGQVVRPDGSASDGAVLAQSHPPVLGVN